MLKALPEGQQCSPVGLRRSLEVLMRLGNLGRQLLHILRAELRHQQAAVGDVQGLQMLAEIRPVCNHESASRSPLHLLQ